MFIGHDALGIALPMSTRKDIAAMLPNFLDARRSNTAVRGLLLEIVNMRALYANERGNFHAERILNSNRPNDPSGNYTQEELRAITIAIFNSIIAPLSGKKGEGQGEGEITAPELKLIALIMNINATILPPTREGDASEMDVWRSDPINSEELVTVVHSGGAHWERWVESSDRGSSSAKTGVSSSDHRSRSVTPGHKIHSPVQNTTSVENILGKFVGSLTQYSVLPTASVDEAKALLEGISAGQIADNRLDEAAKNLLDLRGKLSTPDLGHLWTLCSRVHKAVSERSAALAAKIAK